MNRAQQLALRKFNEASEEYLFAFGWKLENGRWFHPRAHNGTMSFTTWDALAETRANALVRLG